MNTYVPYWIIVNPLRGMVWAKNGYKFNSFEEAKSELDTQIAFNGGNCGWGIEEQGYWTKKDKDDDF